MSATPLTIITGFLGAGKTTLLNRILSADHGLRIAVLVNDFGAVNIDAALIVNVEGETYSLSNGCICCTIREDLVKAVLDVLNRPDPPEYIVIETSGVSDPLEVALTLRPINAIAIDSILTVIDAEQITSLERQYAVLAMNQVGMADIVILNKVDLVDATGLAKARAYIKRVMPDARIYETTHGAVPLPLILNVGSFDAERLASRMPDDVHVHEAGDGDGHDDHDHPDHSLAFSTWTYTSPKPMSLKALQRMVENLPDSIYRTKGTVYLADEPDTPSMLQVVGRRATVTSQFGGWSGRIPVNQLVFIGTHGGIVTELLASQLEACWAENAPKNELERMTNAALAWLRRIRQPEN
jgi:G3E family GTPase